MNHEPELERLRHTCSARLKLFIAATRKTERSIKKLNLPVSVKTAKQLSSQRTAEVQAYENYHLASMMLRDFLGQHSPNVH